MNRLDRNEPGMERTVTNPDGTPGASVWMFHNRPGVYFDTTGNVLENGEALAKLAGFDTVINTREKRRKFLQAAALKKVDEQMAKEAAAIEAELDAQDAVNREIVAAEAAAQEVKDAAARKKTLAEEKVSLRASMLEDTKLRLELEAEAKAEIAAAKAAEFQIVPDKGKGKWKVIDNEGVEVGGGMTRGEAQELAAA